MMPPSRQKKLQMLTQSIARGDIAAARKVLDGTIAAAKAAEGQNSENKEGESGGVGEGETKTRSEDVESSSSFSPPLPLSASPPLSLEEACPGVENQSASAGSCWLIRRTLQDISPDSLHVATNYAAILRGARQRIDELKASAALCHAANALPDDLLFMDIETCGLAGTAIFLVGVMFYAQGQLQFEQYLARDYSEEPAILQAFADKLAAAAVLVTFNGKAFDMNQIRERATFHAVTVVEGKGPPHLDLLMESRKRWRKVLPNCRLQTLEQHFCHRRRVGDIPGWAIPDAYHQFVAARDARQMKDIIHHNTLDLLTMAELLCAILTGSEPGGEQ